MSIETSPELILCNLLTCDEPTGFHLFGEEKIAVLMSKIGLTKVRDSISSSSPLTLPTLSSSSLIAGIQLPNEYSTSSSYAI